MVDGMSSDETRQVIEPFAATARFRLLDNERRITPGGHEHGHRGGQRQRDRPHGCPRRVSRRLYFVAGPAAGTERGRQRGRRLPHAAGQRIGHGQGDRFRHVAPAGRGQFALPHRRRREDRWVDTVPFGCYRREVFDRIGMFDEELVRNQDDELNLRLIRSGGRILLSPRVVCKYFARDSLLKLWRMYYQYGYYKPLVARRLRPQLPIPLGSQKST